MFILFYKMAYHKENNYTMQVTYRLIQVDSSFGIVTVHSTFWIPVVLKSQICVHFGIFIHPKFRSMISNINQESISYDPSKQFRYWLSVVEYWQFRQQYCYYRMGTDPEEFFSTSFGAVLQYNFYFGSLLKVWYQQVVHNRYQNATEGKL